MVVQQGGYLEECKGFLIKNLDDRVILDVMDDLVWQLVRYPEHFMSISLFKVSQEWGVKKWGTWRMLMVPDRRLGGEGHPRYYGYNWWTQRSYPESFVPLSLFLAEI